MLSLFDFTLLQEELKILRLRASLLIEEELDTQEIELTRLVEHKKSLKVHSTYFQFVLTAMIPFNCSEVFNLQRNVDTEKNTCMVNDIFNSLSDFV